MIEEGVGGGGGGGIKEKWTIDLRQVILPWDKER